MQFLVDAGPDQWGHQQFAYSPAPARSGYIDRIFYCITVTRPGPEWTNSTKARYPALLLGNEDREALFPLAVKPFRPHLQGMRLIVPDRGGTNNDLVVDGEHFRQ